MLNLDLVYNDLAQLKIIIPPNTNYQLHSIFVLIGFLKAGNNNKDILYEISSLLDELRKNNIISKLVYKTLYYKAKQYLESNIK